MPEPARKSISARKLSRIKRRARAKGLLDGVLAMLEQGDLAVDCGANVGLITEKLAATPASVVAFEPDPVAFAQLHARCAHFDNVTLIPAAVGTTAGTARLIRSRRFADDPLAATVSSSILPGKRDADTDAALEVDQIDLAAFLLEKQASGLRLAFLKMDVEGIELQLLPHLDQTGVLAQIKCALVETHQRKFPDQRGAFLQMRRQIAARYPSRHVNMDWI